MDEAYKSFKTTRAETTDAILTDEVAIRAEFDLLRGQFMHEKQNHVGFMDLFRHKSLRKRCIVGFITMFGAQGTATLVINSKSMTPSVSIHSRKLKDLVRLRSIAVLQLGLRYCPAAAYPIRMDICLSFWELDQRASG